MGLESELDRISSADILSDVIEPTVRPRMEEFERGFFVTIKMMELNEKMDKVSVDNLSLVVIDNYIFILGVLGDKIEKLGNRMFLNPECTIQLFRCLGSDGGDCRRHALVF